MQRVRVHVSRAGGGKDTAVEAVRCTLRSRLLTRLAGNRYSVLVLTPVGMNVEAVEIVEKDKPPSSS